MIKRIAHTKWFKKLIDKYFYIKLCLNRADGYAGFPMDLVTKMIILATFLEVFNITNWTLISVSAIVMVGIYILVGHTDLKYRLIDREVSLHNKYNPEIQKILKNKEKK